MPIESISNSCFESGNIEDKRKYCRAKFLKWFLTPLALICGIPLSLTLLIVLIVIISLDISDDIPIDWAIYGPILTAFVISNLVLMIWAITLKRLRSSEEDKQKRKAIIKNIIGICIGFLIIGGLGFGPSMFISMLILGIIELGVDNSIGWLHVFISPLLGVIGVMPYIIVVRKHRKRTKESEIKEIGAEREHMILEDVDDFAAWFPVEEYISFVDDPSMEVPSCNEPLSKETIGQCAICKLAIRKDQTVFKCKECNSLFHNVHINNWLTIMRICPVCKHRIS